MTHHVFAFDWDGTLVQHVGDVVFDDPASLREGCIRDRAAQRRVLQLVQDGHAVHVVTARGRKVRDITLEQVRDLHPDITVHHQEKWTGYTGMRDWKAKVLRQVGAQAYVGDHIMDEMAAELAGVPFMHADAYRAGGDLLALADGGHGGAVAVPAQGKLLRANGGKHPAVKAVVPGDRVAGPGLAPEERRLAKRGGPRAPAGQETPGAVKPLVGKHEPVDKPIHGAVKRLGALSPRAKGSAAKAQGA